MKWFGISCLFVCAVFSAHLSSAQETATQSVVDQYKQAAGKIMSSARKGNDAYMKLQELCDDIGNRLSGSEALDKAIQWAVKDLESDGHENVRAEKVMVRKWVRGNEFCELISPRPMKINMLGLGGSVGTPPEGITAEVIVVDSKEELDSLPDEAIKGKIVCFNAAMPPFSETEGSGYGKTVAYRGSGAMWAAERGGVAALVRSVTAYSLDSPHTGSMRKYLGGPDAVRVPAAAITVEAATLMRRLQDRGKKIEVKLHMEAKDYGEVPSANVIAEIVGSEFPNEVVIIGGHIDSWDVGTGAQDDGCGCVVAMEALNIIRKLGLQPRRTIRVVLWTNEENGIAGALSYAARHAEEDCIAGIESDSGGFKPEGLSVEHIDDDTQLKAVEHLTDVLKLLEPLGATRVKTGFSGVDIGRMKDLGTVCMGLNVDGRLYFNTHHTEADTVDKVDPDELTDCAITVAVASYVIADMPERLGGTKPKTK